MADLHEPEAARATPPSSPGDERAESPERTGLPTGESLSPDLRILVREGRRDGQSTLSYELKAREPDLELNYASFGPVTLRVEPRRYFEECFQGIENLTRGDAAAREATQHRLAGKGSTLAKELLPAGLGELLGELQGKVNTVQLLSEEGWIPWELLQLRRRENGRWVSSRFLCEAFALSRWRPGIPEHLHLPLHNLAVVGGRDPDLPAAAGERAYIETLRGPHRTIRSLPATYEDVIENLASGKFDGWHFTGHGLAGSEDPNRWSIILEDYGELKPEDLNSEAANLGQAQPLVFLNACHTAKGALSLTHVGGWAAQLLDVGAGAFIGASWATGDEAAKEFAKAFYREFLRGVPIGEAVRRARMEIRENFPGDPTWLAYAVFAHPLASCAEAGRTAAEGTATDPGVERRPAMSEASGPKTSANGRLPPQPTDTSRIPPQALRGSKGTTPGGARRRSSKRVVVLTTALISAMVVVVAGLLTTPWLDEARSRLGVPKEVLVRVADRRGAAVRGAEVLLFAEGGPYRATTDSYGSARLVLLAASDTAAQLVIQSAGHEIVERLVRPSHDDLIDVRLSPRNPESANVLFRVIDGANGEPIPNAGVQLLLGADPYSQTTDTNGLVKFAVGFRNGKVDAQISVRTPSYTIEYQRITLRPNTVQDVRLDRQAATLAISTPQ